MRMSQWIETGQSPALPGDYQLLSGLCVQSNLAKQLAKLVKVKYVENITDASRVGGLPCVCPVVCRVLVHPPVCHPRSSQTTFLGCLFARGSLVIASWCRPFPLVWFVCTLPGTCRTSGQTAGDARKGEAR